MGMQFELECCGSAGYQDWFGSQFTASNIDKPVPFTCCRMNEGVHKPEGPADVADITQCYAEARLYPGEGNYQHLHAEGCYFTIRDTLQQHMYIVIGVCGIVVILEVFALWVASNVRAKLVSPYK